MEKNKQLSERLKLYGGNALTTKELIALIIGNTKETKGKLPIEIANDLIEKNEDFTNNLKFLEEITVEQLLEIDGLSEENAVKLKAVAEICKRYSSPFNAKKIVIESTKDVADLFMDELRNESMEKIKIVILNSKNVVQRIMTLSEGTTDSALVRTRDILAEPIKMKAPKFILVHNHPSGDSKPSAKDLKASKIIYNCAAAMGIEFLDHIVIGNGTFESAL